MSYAIYGKRCGLVVDGEPVYDKSFRALDYDGVRVTKLADAGTYVEKADAQEVIDKYCQDYKDAGLVEYEIRTIK